MRYNNKSTRLYVQKSASCNIRKCANWLKEIYQSFCNSHTKCLYLWVLAKHESFKFSISNLIHETNMSKVTKLSKFWSKKNINFCKANINCINKSETNRIVFSWDLFKIKPKRWHLQFYNTHIVRKYHSNPSTNIHWKFNVRWFFSVSAEGYLFCGVTTQKPSSAHKG